jgi:putative transposase
VLFVSPGRIAKLAAVIKPATLFKFHKALVDRKYRLLFSSAYRRRKPGPKGPSAELIAAIVELKRRNPRFGCVRIAQQIAHAFGVDIDKDVVRRVLMKHYRPGDSGTNGPSWLTFIGHMKDALWSVDLFRCESILLHSHWVLMVMDVYTRRLVGFDVERANIDGVSVCRMFNRAIAGQPLPKRVSTDHDPSFHFHRWLANLRVLAIEEVKSVPYAPVSHPFIERLIGTVRREYLDHVFFWNAIDLTRKLDAFADYYNAHRGAPLPFRHHACAIRLRIFLSRNTCCSSSICVEGAFSRAFSHTDSSMSTNSPRTGCRDQPISPRCLVCAHCDSRPRPPSPSTAQTPWPRRSLA